MKVYLVEDQGNSPGRIYCIMASEEDAEFMQAMILGQLIQNGELEPHVGVVPRTLFYGQPPVRGYNE